MILLGEEWCTMDGVLSHINQVESYARLDSKAFASLHSRLVEAESTIRHEWHRVTQQDRSISLDDAIELSWYTPPYCLCSFPRFYIQFCYFSLCRFKRRGGKAYVWSKRPSDETSFLTLPQEYLVCTIFHDDFQKCSVAFEARIRTTKNAWRP